MANKGTAFSVDVIATLLHLTTKRVKQLTDEGIIEEVAPKYYKLAPTVTGYVKYLQNRLSYGDPTSDYNTEKAKLTCAKREAEELALAFKKNELHKASDIEFAMTTMLVAFRAKLTTLPHKVLPNILNNISDKDKLLELLAATVLEAWRNYQNIAKNYSPTTSTPKLKTALIMKNCKGVQAWKKKRFCL